MGGVAAAASYSRTAAVLGLAKARHVGISLLASMGNEGMLTSTDVIEYLLEDDNTKVIALFLESIWSAPATSRCSLTPSAAGRAGRTRGVRGEAPPHLQRARRARRLGPPRPATVRVTAKWGLDYEPLHSNLTKEKGSQ